MPVSFTALGDYLNVTIIDGNFNTLQDLLRAGLVSADFTDKFDRYKISRYTQGKLESVSTHAREPIVHTKNNSIPDHSDYPFIKGKFDITFRSKDRSFTAATTYPTNFPEEADLSSTHFELLGKPGPSFFFDWQEDGYPEPTLAAGWPPTGWPFKRYPDELCYSQWVTVPEASIKVCVQKPALAKVTASCIVSQNMFRYLMFEKYISDSGLTATNSLFNTNPAAKHGNLRYFNFSSYGLFVDTNPVLYTDEFANSNINIASSFVSWKKIVERTFQMPQRAQIKLVGYVPIVGAGRYYNFSLKNRSAGHHGHIIAGTWSTNNYENSIPDYGNREANWIAQWNTRFGTPATQDFTRRCWHPNFISLWESTSLSVELLYGRDEAVNSYSNTEMTDMTLGAY